MLRNGSRSFLLMNFLPNILESQTVDLIFDLLEESASFPSLRGDEAVGGLRFYKFIPPTKTFNPSLYQTSSSNLSQWDSGWP